MELKINSKMPEEKFVKSEILRRITRLDPVECINNFFNYIHCQDKDIENTIEKRYVNKLRCEIEQFFDLIYKHKIDNLTLEELKELYCTDQLNRNYRFNEIDTQSTVVLTRAVRHYFSDAEALPIIQQYMGDKLLELFKKSEQTQRQSKIEWLESRIKNTNKFIEDCQKEKIEFEKELETLLKEEEKEKGKEIKTFIKKDIKLK